MIEIVSDDVPVVPAVKGTLFGFRVAVGPAGATVPVRFTAPARLFRLVTVIATWAVEVVPPCIVTLVAFAVRVKSGPTRRVAFTSCISVPLVPFTVTL